MNLYFRLIWTLLRVWCLPAIRIDEPFERTFRVLPNDIDINLHLNNGRYLTIADLMIVEFFGRTGFLRSLFKNKWKPVLGGTTVTYRKQLKLGEKYRLRYRWVGSDTHWNYLRFEFLKMDGTLCASGYSKGAALSRSGLVQTETALQALGKKLEMPVLPEAVVRWVESEKLLLD
ncbi:Thioesterase domain-containing protein [Sulfitobacter noctilucicola]|uniref:Acyl-CoA thioesterase FadM n=1 Tax=Sulfitobacter noctilucicola TaxID=1342301 RepID=A0A7W6Q5E0_9RHOB|nr:thioesterase family protein [Sulfitobacter noctilucicola]KIN63287.1 Thioesterase domain-containing protein [Sulfitobacter noctilucicola]MBB4175194.1 acyl-CoA thioesterase FadM [Sulfitobacter noctilucicola]